MCCFGSRFGQGEGDKKGEYLRRVCNQQWESQLRAYLRGAVGEFREGVSLTVGEWIYEGNITNSDRVDPRMKSVINKRVDPRVDPRRDHQQQ